VAAALAAAPAASADVGLTGGNTTLKLDRGTARALDGLGVSVAPVSGARAAGGGIRFPISGGSIDPATAEGTIRHRGGLRLRAGHTRVVLSQPRVAITERAVRLSARVGKSRINIATLSGARVARDGFNTDVRNLRARLTQNAARALNGAFGVTAFKRGLTLGRVTVRSETNETELAATGATALAVDAGALQALTSLGIAPGVIGPATLEGTTASFPITGGESELDLDPALVRHSGGLSLTKGATVVRLTDFDIVLGGEAGPQLLASLNGGEEKVAILDLDLTGVTPAVQGRAITVPGVTAKLSAGAAQALNQAFGTTAFAAGLVLGKATVSARGR
jgi:hypothetical protein